MSFLGTGYASNYPAENCHSPEGQKVEIQNIPAQNSGSSSGISPPAGPSNPVTTSGSGVSSGGDNNNGKGVNSATQGKLSHFKSHAK